jgi:hypothetical protein
MNHNVTYDQFSERKAREHSEKTSHSDARIRTGACCSILIKIIFEKINNSSMNIKFYENLFGDHGIAKLTLTSTTKSGEEFLPKQFYNNRYDLAKNQTRYVPIICHC